MEYETEEAIQFAKLLIGNDITKTQREMISSEATIKALLNRIYELENLVFEYENGRHN